MLRLTAKLMLSSILFFPLNIVSAEIISCDDLDLTADNLKELYETFHDALHDSESEILNQNNVLDNMLRDVSDNLQIISSSREEHRLLRLVNSMEDAWVNKNNILFAEATDNSINELDRIIQKDCN